MPQPHRRVQDAQRSEKILVIRERIAHANDDEIVRSESLDEVAD